LFRGTTSSPQGIPASLTALVGAGSCPPYGPGVLLGGYSFRVVSKKSDLNSEGLHRRSKDAKVSEPSLHDFRRAFALTMLRNNTDVYTLAKLMGHEGITVLQRYLKQTYQDNEAAHRRAEPVDNSNIFGLV